MSDDLIERLLARADMHVAATPATMLREAAARIRELEAELETCRKYRDAYRQCDEIATAHVRRLEAKRDEALRSRDGWMRGWYALEQDTKADLSQCRKRAEAAEAERDKLREAGDRLSFCAQTSGGSAGTDDDLVDAINGWADARALSETEGE